MRRQILDVISLSKTRVFYGLQRVLLCGGKTPDISSHQNFSSLRHGLYCSLRPGADKLAFLIPEHHVEWTHDGVYKNLVDFENDLASISHLIVVILETVSAIAEAAIFVSLPGIARKVLLVIPQHYHGSSSYIELGIARLISEQSSMYFTWDEANSRTVSDELISEVMSDLEERVAGLNKTEFFEKSRSGHLIILVYSLVKMFVALKESEIEKYLDVLNVGFGNKTRLRQILFMLTCVRALKKVPYSSEKYYMVDDEKFCFARFAFNDAKVNLHRVEGDVMEFYRSSDRERNRIRAIGVGREYI